MKVLSSNRSRLLPHKRDNLGSNPRRTTKNWGFSANGNTSALHAEVRGSIPRSSTKFAYVAVREGHRLSTGEGGFESRRRRQILQNQTRVDSVTNRERPVQSFNNSSSGTDLYKYSERRHAMQYTIYKVTNLLNGKIYIGKHACKCKNICKYFGSGKAIKAAIARHGKENFLKEIVALYQTEADMNEAEKELITEEFVARSDTYNCGIGGEGGPHFKGKTHSQENKELFRQMILAREVTPETRAKIAEGNRSRPMTEETRRKLSERQKARYERERLSRGRLEAGSSVVS